MPRKKQVTFQQTIEGKFIPRKSSPTTSVYPLGATANRFNSKMVEYLTSSSTNDDETPIETTTMSQSKCLRQQIVTMLDSAKKTTEDSSPMPIVATRSILKSQPITFGQLRQKTSLRTSFDLEENLTESKITEEQRIEPTSTIEQINSVVPKSSTSVEEILAKFYIHSTLPITNVQSNNENRAPPPSYASSITNNYHRNPIGDASRLSSTLSSKSSSQSLSNLSLTIGNVSTRSPPPRYRTPSPPTSSSKTVNSTTFDHKFSRFLYGKDSNKYRRTRSKRKALSDPVKKEIDEANRFNDKSRRRFTTNLQDIDTDKEEQSDEVESSTEPQHKGDLISSVRRRTPRSNNFFRRNLVPASPGLKRRIPTFLRVYSQASPSTDLLLQWDLFNIPELETLDMMMGRLYKNENLARVQSYEIYRTVLLNLLSSKRI